MRSGSSPEPDRLYIPHWARSWPRLDVAGSKWALRRANTWRSVVQNRHTFQIFELRIVDPQEHVLSIAPSFPWQIPIQLKSHFIRARTCCLFVPGHAATPHGLTRAANSSPETNNRFTCRPRVRLGDAVQEMIQRKGQHQRWSHTRAPAYWRSFAKNKLLQCFVNRCI